MHRPGASVLPLNAAAKTVLIVEDDRSTRDLLQRSLERAGYQTLQSIDGYHGLKLAQLEKPDLIILDVVLPKMNGYKISRLLKFDEKYKHIPVIMLTSQEKHDQEMLGRESGADEYVYKSAPRAALIKLVDKYLKPSPD